MPAPALATSDPGSTRTPLRIDVDKGRLETAGHSARFDPAVEDDALIAYLKLVRRLRDVEREPSFVLRRDDVVILAGALREDAVVVLDRLGELMGATVTQRRSMVTAFLAGALLIAVATGATALAPSDGHAPVHATGGERTDAVASAPADGDRHGGTPDRATTRAPAGGPARGQAGSNGGTAEAAAGELSSPSAGATASTAVSRPVPLDRGAPRGDVDRPEPGVRDVGPSPQPGRSRPGREIIQPGATIDIPNDEIPDGREIVQPGADIDIPNDEVDEDLPVGIPTPPGDEEDLPVLLPPAPPVDVAPPVGPPVGVAPPVGPPVDVAPPVGPPVDVAPPVMPPLTPPPGPPVDDTRGNGDGNRGIGRGNGGGNGTANEGNGVGPKG